ncbi:hypothetical protein FPF71_05425 [Algibacter amylolyticus]|uniref:Type I restriction modification DNA specificity domain-containing protein n=1 Tax=Algibacter amylolyticus TaxID=1608400 RepID=A0A5M7B9I6_9FLAO|nr:restriction endonuclease subunit S [Algibacter amylolyticus]KAA5826256.1 hypothetical protein F2B50_05425 [Algibacter amylolyticus]MBB5268459.1 type I restriction enzyme S subunit [Algibacter amylolyticus]TSJ80294.1 hypothetical protein FPF71_05425 [Algibacter amylolyticus]
MKDNFVSTITKRLEPYKLPSNWKWFFWEDIMRSYQQGMIRSNSQLGEGNVEYLKMGDIDINGTANLDNLKRTEASERELKEFKLNNGDFLINVRNSLQLVGKTCVVDNIEGRKILYNHMLVRIDNGNSEMNYFINAFLNIPSSKKLLDRIKEGTTTVIALYQRELNKLPIALPDTITFTSIVNVYKNIRVKIEVNNKINQELEAMAKTLYDYWFVQFEFPTSEAQAKRIGNLSLVGKPYKSSGGLMVFNEALNREIPEGWEVDELGDVLKTELGGTPSTKIREFWDGDIPWLNSGEIANFPIIDSEEYITEDSISKSATSLMPKGTCVLSITRHLRPSILGIDACANQSVVGILESDKLKASFIYPYLVNEIPRLMTLRTGAQQPHINKKTVDTSLIINPSLEVLKDYYKLANPIYDQIINNSFQNQKLSALRDWLLPMLMNGQVRVAHSYADGNLGRAEQELGMVAEDNTKFDNAKYGEK